MIKTIIKCIFLLGLGCILAYLWYGFLYPDPVVLNYGLVVRLLFLWLPRILLPALYLLVALLILVRKKEIRQNLSLLLLSFLVILLIAYPLMDISYYMKEKKRMGNAKEEYHAFLQLKPDIQRLAGKSVNDSAVRIFCLGGSTTEFPDSKGKGWPSKLEEELRKHFQTDFIEVYNFGRQWYTSLHSLINYESNLRDYNPDVIIYLHNINDLLCNADFSYFSSGPFRGDYGHFNGPSKDLFQRFGLFGTSWNHLKSMWHHNPRTAIVQDSFPGLASYTRNINTLMDLAEMDSTRVILLSQPNLFESEMSDEIKQICYMINAEAVGPTKKWDHKTGYLGMLQYNKRIEEISRNRGIHFIDLEKEIPKSLTYFYDDVHYQDTTFNIISTLIRDEIIDLGVIQGNPNR